MEEVKKDTQNLEGETTPTLEAISEDSNTGQVLPIPNSSSDIIEDIPTEPIKSSETEIVIEEVAKPQNIDNVVQNENDAYGNKLVTLKKDENPTDIKKEVKVEEVTEKIEQEVIGDLFVNYDSEFHKNQKSILQKIRLFKMTPKTSIGFVLILIIITVSGIGIMMKIDPKNHNINNYKANILAMVGIKQEIKEATGSIASNTGIVNNSGGTDTTGTGVTDSGTIDTTGSGETSSGVLDEKEKMMIKEKWFTINPKVIYNADGSTSFIYKGKIYTKEELQEELRKEVEQDIDKKTKDYLNKIYIDTTSTSTTTGTTTNSDLIPPPETNFQ